MASGIPPARDTAAHGLAADAWNNLDASQQGGVSHTGHRPFSKEKMKRTLDAEID